MPLYLFELACIAVVAATLALMGRATDRRELLLDYLTLAVAGYVGEQSSISLYGFYAYASGWHGRIGSVPILVPVIWPLVILSARDVARAILPPGASLLRRAVAVFAIVGLDASLVEVIAVRAGLWSWAEPGHLGVPLIGILGWGFFAFGASLPRHRVLAGVAAVVATHALVLATWWGLFRWIARGDLAMYGFAVLFAAAAGALSAAIRARRSGRVLSPAVWGPRVLAATLFFVLYAATAPRDGALLAHALLVAVPYVAATSIRRTRSAGALPAATAPFR